jgi:hypothetical protein
MQDRIGTSGRRGWQEYPGEGTRRGGRGGDRWERGDDREAERFEGAKERELDQLASGLDDPSLPPEETARIILRLGREGHLRAWSKIERHFEHASADVRRASLQTLVFDWRMDPYRERCERFTLEDPDPDVRRFSATCLGLLLQSTGDRRGLRHLASLARKEDESPRVRGAAYVGLLRILGKRGKDIPFIGNVEDLNARVDWALVEACGDARWSAVPFEPPTA